ncbi:MAG: TIGR01777 family oxidoreductase [Gemmatimonadota bacterium]
MSASNTIAITGASGMIGQALTAALQADGRTILPISRHAIPGGTRWDPGRGILDTGALEGVDAIIHLAGESIAAGRWTPARKTLLRESRLTPTRLLAETIGRLTQPPRVLISASAVGIYGNRGDERLDERATFGTDFLARLGQEWEAAADPARAVGVRVVHPRFGVVLSTTGGALKKLLPPFRLGLGGPVGDGKQWLAWIAISDVVGVVRHLLANADLAGPVNAVAPGEVTNGEFGRILGRVLHRPAVLPLPAFALKLAFGEMAEATLLASQRVVPAVLSQSGYQWSFPELEPALQAIVHPTAVDRR